MKNLLLCYFLCVISINNAVAQSKHIALSDAKYDEYNKTKEKGILKGKIINATAEELKAINIEYAFVNITEPSQSTFNTKVSEDGTFTIEQNQNIPYQQLWFSLGNYAYTCLYLNNELEITFDFNKLKQKKVYILGDGITFSGVDGELNKTMNEYVLFDKKNNSDFSKKVRTLNIKDKEYVQKLDSLFDIQRKVDSSFIANNQNYDFLIHATTNAQYNYQLLSYYLQNNINIENLTHLLTPIYSISNETSQYIRFLRYYMDFMYSKKNSESRNDYTKIFDFVDNVLPQNFGEIVKINFDDRDLAIQNQIYKTAIKVAKTNWSRNLLTQEIEILDKKENEVKSLLSNPKVGENSSLGQFVHQLPFHADLYINSSIDGKSLLKEVKAKFPNKLIILDIWATWCVPCLGQMPASKKLHELAKEKDLPIEFVYLCTDGNSDRSKWENKIVELKQPGTHLFVSNKNISDLFQLFNRSGYPTYVAIKPNGEIDTKSISWISELKIEDLEKMLN